MSALKFILLNHIQLQWKRNHKYNLECFINFTRHISQKIMSNTKFTIFEYESKNFSFHLNESDNADSEFDSILKQKWEQVEKDKILRYPLNIKEWRILKGQYGFVAQLNLDRAWNRRTPENISSMSQPFDPQRFNFTKIPEREIYFDIGNGDGNDVIAANVSPIEWGHCLFLSERLRCLPQRITEYSLRKAIDLMLLSNSLYLRIIFNSLCGHASVNHLHWHLYYLRHKMLLEHIVVPVLKDPVFLLTDYPANGFCLKLSSFEYSIQDFVSCTYVIISYLQKHEIAHNVYITRAKRKYDEKGYNDVRIYIWARESNTGVRNITTFIPAACELFGHLPIITEEAYKSLTEEEVAEVLNNVTTSTFNKVKADIQALFEENHASLKNFTRQQDNNI